MVLSAAFPSWGNPSLHKLCLLLRTDLSAHEDLETKRDSTLPGVERELREIPEGWESEHTAHAIRS